MKRPVDQIRAGMTIRFEAPRVPTPSNQCADIQLGYRPPGGEVVNPSRVTVVSRVTKIERSPDGDFLLHTQRKIIYRCQASDYVTVDGRAID